VLVACPTYSGLSDCLEEYLKSYQSFTWKNRDLLLVDNTKGDEYTKKIQSYGVNVIHVEPLKKFQDTFTKCWEEIYTYASGHLFQWVFSLEQDVICPPLTIDTLLNIASYLQSPFVTHLYPYHWGVKNMYQGLGCTLISTSLLGEAIELNKKDGLIEGSIYQVAVSRNHASLANLLDVKHLDGQKRYWHYEKETDPRVKYPKEYEVLDSLVKSHESN
jgi:hypothetical protein